MIVGLESMILFMLFSSLKCVDFLWKLIGFVITLFAVIGFI